MVSQPSVPLQQMGKIITDNFYGLIAQTIFQGVFILLFSLGIASLLQRGLGSRSTQAMLSLAVISFMSATGGWAVCVALIVTQIRGPMVENLGVPLKERLHASNHEIIKLRVVGAWVGRFLPVIADSVVIWRAWVIFFENRLAMIAPLVLLLGTIATTLTYLALDTNVETSIKSGQGAFNLPAKFFTAGLAFSLVTNAVATMMVGYKLWAHRTLLARMLGREQRFTRAQNVLVIIVESGMFFFVLQLTTIILNITTAGAPNGSARSTVALVFNYIYFHFSAMYPLIVIVLVNNQHSFVETCGFTSIDLNGAQTHGPNTSAHPTTPGHLSFAPPTATKTQLVDSRNATREDNADAELRVFERGFKNEDIDLAEKRQASTAPF